MSLRLKLNLILLCTALLGLSFAALLGRDIFYEHAGQELREIAQVAMEGANAIRHYTQTEIRPLLEAKNTQDFTPQQVPAYSASRFFHLLQKKRGNLHYKEASNNPINAANWATDWESDLIQWFKEHPEETQFIGERSTPTGSLIYLSRPIRVSPDCLVCHDTPAKAPKAMLDRYGATNGYGWQVDEVAAIQTISVPRTKALERAAIEYRVFLVSLAVAFILIGLAMNLLLHFLVIRPIKTITAHVNQVSLGTLSLPELPVQGKDEIASLSQSFNRMQRSLNSAIAILGNEDG